MLRGRICVANLKENTVSATGQADRRQERAARGTGLISLELDLELSLKACKR